jgi:ABC-type branched-subunit amino acid transport system ATPase component
MLVGLADSPTAVSVMGLSTNVTRVIVFCISAFFAAIAGELYGGSIHIVTGGEQYYTAFNSLILVAILAIAPFAATPWYAIFAGITAVIPAFLPGKNTPYWLNAIFGFFAVLVATEGGPRRMPARYQAWFDRLGRPRPEGVRPPIQQPVPAPALVREAGSRRGLDVTGLTVRFGGRVAVQDLSVKAPPATITGLIGPNGAGKTTTFNACFGLARASSGVIEIDAHDVSHLSPPARARLGLGRTFQITELCDSLSVQANVSLGRETGLAGRRIYTQLWAPRHEKQATESATWSALELCGIAQLADKQAGSLSTGERRLVELARCLAGPFDLLLLDEPSAGLDRSETAQFADVLRRVVDEREIGILLVEHDMSLVMSVCSYLYVLDFGSLIYQGVPAEIAASEVVKSAYLGNSENVFSQNA